MRLSASEEQRLIRAAQSGCARSSQRLIETHQDRLHAFIWRMTRNAHDAEDVCQEAFLRAFGALDGFDFRYRFSTWLFTIGYRLCVNQIQRRRGWVGDAEIAAQNGACKPWQDEPAPADEAVANSEEARRIKDVVWSAVDGLSPPQRATVLLYYREQLDCQQIGEVLSIPSATVKSHLHRARARLKDTLEARLADDWTSVRFGTDGN